MSWCVHRVSRLLVRQENVSQFQLEWPLHPRGLRCFPITSFNTTGAWLVLPVHVNLSAVNDNCHSTVYQNIPGRGPQSILNAAASRSFKCASANTMSMLIQYQKEPEPLDRHLKVATVLESAQRSGDLTLTKQQVLELIAAVLPKQRGSPCPRGAHCNGVGVVI